LVRNPAVYSDTFTTSPTSGVVSLTRVQDGSSTKNETYNLAIGPDAEGGSVIFNYNSNSTTAVPIGASAVSFSEALSSLANVGSGNISVDIGNNAGNYSISFVRALGLQNLPDLTLDASGVIFGNFLQTTVTMATAQLDELFAEAGTDTIIPKIEVELTQNGTPKTVLQTNVTVRRDLITTGSAVPSSQASYLTAAESYAAFVEDINTNVDATNRKLYNSTGSVFLDWQNNTIGTGATILDLSGTAVTITDGYNIGVGTTFGTKIGTSTASKIAFYGSTAITKPTGTNIVSGITNLGLLSYTSPTALNVVSALEQTGILTNNTSTFGVFPLSSRTLTTTASLNFGAVGSNSSTSITVAVTGAIVNDIVLIGLPTAISEGLSFLGHVVGTNQVHIDATNATNSSKTQSAQTFRVTVIGY
jgi:hypothetical protein